MKESKKDFYNNLKVIKVTDKKHFSKIIKPNFTDKILNDEDIIVVEDDKVITAETELAKIFKDHFENIVENLHIERPCKVDLDKKSVVNAIKNISLYPSILKSKKIQISSARFSFHTVSKQELLYQLNNLDPQKKLRKSVIFQRVLSGKIMTYFHGFFLQTLITLFQHHFSQSS